MQSNDTTIIHWKNFSEEKPENETECFVKLSDNRIVLGIYREAYKGIDAHWIISNGYGFCGNITTNHPNHIVCWCENKAEVGK